MPQQDEFHKKKATLLFLNNLNDAMLKGLPAKHST